MGWVLRGEGRVRGHGCAYARSVFGSPLPIFVCEWEYHSQQEGPEALELPKGPGPSGRQGIRILRIPWKRNFFASTARMRTRVCARVYAYGKCESDYRIGGVPVGPSGVLFERENYCPPQRLDRGGGSRQTEGWSVRFGTVLFPVSGVPFGSRLSTCGLDLTPPPNSPGGEPETEQGSLWLWDDAVAPDITGDER